MKAREQFRVPKDFKLRDEDAGANAAARRRRQAGQGRDQAAGARADRAADRTARGVPGDAVRAAQAQGAAGPAGHGHLGQGRHDQVAVQPHQPDGPARGRLPRAERRRTRARLPVARAPAGAGTGRDRASSTAAITKTCWCRGCDGMHRRQGGRARASRTSATSSACWPKPAPSSSRCSCTSRSDEQRERLQERIDDPDKQWKFDPLDLEQRKQWDDYQRAYEDAISATDTDDAPWYIVPANSKTHRNLIVATLLLEIMKELKLHYPEPDPELAKLKIK